MMMGYRFVAFVNRGGQVRFSSYAPDFLAGHRGGRASCWGHAVRMVRQARGRHRASCSFFYDQDTMVVYRLYGTMYVMVGTDRDENLLAVHEAIQSLLQVLDAIVGGGVCELDIIRHLDKIHFVVESFFDDPMPSKGRLVADAGYLEQAELLLE